MFTFIGTDVENLINIKQIVFFSENYFGTSNKNTDKQNSFWELIYVTEGQISVSVNDTKIVINSGEVMFHPPFENHKISTHNCEQFDGYTIAFTCSSKAMDYFKGWKGKMSDCSQKLFSFMAEEAKNSFKVSLVDKNFYLIPSDNMPLGGFQVFRNYLELLIINILREELQLMNLKTVFPKKDNLYPEITRQVASFLAENIYGDISIEKLCKKFNYSRTLLCTKFKEYYGDSIMKYYTTLKIREACKLLDAGEYSVAQISTLLSYSNPYNFSRTFKKLLGISPSQYQKQNK